MGSRTTRLSALALLSVLALTPAGAAVTKLTLLSPEHERQVGAEALAEVQREFGFYAGPDALQPYLDGVVSKLGAQSRRKDLPWAARVLDTPQLYAFCLPGGTVCVSRGLLASLGSEGETAAALAPEMAHVALGHGELRVTGSDLSAFMRGTLTHYDPDLVTRLDGAVNLALGLALCGYVRPQDEEADAEALLMIQKAGYDPGCAAALFRRLLDLEAKEPARCENYLLSHLPTQGRLEKAQLLAPPEGAECGAAAHAAACAGLPLGKTSGDAFLAGGVYLNRTERIRLEVPAGYDAHFAPDGALVRLARAVRPGDGHAPAELRVEVLPAAAGVTPDGAADAYVASRGLKGVRRGDRDFKTDDGRPLALRIVDEKTREGLLRTFLAVAVEGDRTFVLLGTAHIDRYKVDFPDLMGIIKSFTLLSPAEASALKPPVLGTP